MNWRFGSLAAMCVNCGDPWCGDPIAVTALVVSENGTFGGSALRVYVSSMETACVIMNMYVSGK